MRFIFLSHERFNYNINNTRKGMWHLHAMGMSGRVKAVCSGAQNDGEYFRFYVIIQNCNIFEQKMN